MLITSIGCRKKKLILSPRTPEGPIETPERRIQKALPIPITTPITTLTPIINPSHNHPLITATPLLPVLMLEIKALLRRTSQRTPSLTSWGKMANSSEKNGNAA
jgi:hypothetical protein